MTAREFEEWKIFYKMEPQEPERSDYRTAVSTSQILGALGVKVEDRRIEDLMLTFTEGQESSEEDVEIKLKSWLTITAAQFR